MRRLTMSEPFHASSPILPRGFPDSNPGPDPDSDPDPDPRDRTWNSLAHQPLLSPHPRNLNYLVFLKLVSYYCTHDGKRGSRIMPYEAARGKGTTFPNPPSLSHR